MAKAADAWRSTRAGEDAEAAEYAAGALADLLRIAVEHGVDVGTATRGMQMYEEGKR